MEPLDLNILQKWKNNYRPLLQIAVDRLLGSRITQVIPRRLQEYILLSGDGFLAQSGDSRIDPVPLFNPLSSLYQDSQEACGYLISHFISTLENCHQTLQS